MLTRQISTNPSKDMALLVVVFERPTDPDEVEILKESFKAGNIKTDPATNLEQAILEQHTLELQKAYDDIGVMGYFEIQGITLGREIDRKNLSREFKVL